MRFQLKQYIEDSTLDFNIYSFNDKIYNHLASISQLIETPIHNQGVNDEERKNIMHILQIKDESMRSNDDATSYSDIIAKCWQLIETPTVSAMLHNFKFQFFVRTLMNSIQSRLH
jgi:Mg2+/Co2+ transporter CorC